MKILTSKIYIHWSSKGWLGTIYLQLDSCGKSIQILYFWLFWKFGESSSKFTHAFTIKGSCDSTRFKWYQSVKKDRKKTLKVKHNCFVILARHWQFQRISSSISYRNGQPWQNLLIVPEVPIKQVHQENVWAQEKTKWYTERITSCLKILQLSLSIIEQKGDVHPSLYPAGTQRQNNVHLASITSIKR